MDHKKQARANAMRDEFAEKWMVDNPERARWRLEQSKIGRSRDQPTMLAHRPGFCGSMYAEPPDCNTQVLAYFRTMVLRFLSHREWRRQVYHYWDEVPDKEDWLGDYWERYLRARTANDPWDTFGPLHLYVKYDEARTCSNTKAGFLLLTMK